MLKWAQVSQKIIPLWGTYYERTVEMSEMTSLKIASFKAIISYIHDVIIEKLLMAAC